jgi:hypothetical protein
MSNSRIKLFSDKQNHERKERVKNKIKDIANEKKLFHGSA